MNETRNQRKSVSKKVQPFISNRYNSLGKSKKIFHAQYYYFWDSMSAVNLARRRFNVHEK